MRPLSSTTGGWNAQAVDEISTYSHPFWSDVCILLPQSILGAGGGLSFEESVLTAEAKLMLLSG